MNATSVAESYHEATKYDPEALSRHSHQLDWSVQPNPFKDYPNARQVELGRFLPAARADLADSKLRRRIAAEDQPDLAVLSQLLFFSYGVTEIVRYPDRPLYLRAAPSAGGLYPAEIYLLCRRQRDLPDGLYNYQVRTQTLACLLEGPELWEQLRRACFEHAALGEADLAVVMTGVYYRSSWRYHDRAYRRILLDTGHVLGNLLLYAPQVGRQCVPIGGFCDEALNDLLFLQPSEEGALLVAALPSQPVPFAPAALASPTGPTRPMAEGARLSALHEASGIPMAALPQLPPALPPKTRTRLQFAAAEPLHGPRLEWEDGLAESLLRRRSTRAYSGATCTRSQLATILAFGYEPAMAAPNDMPGPSAAPTGT
ncbi:MAG: SagB/ThcOx family dehydrogenase, partial [Cyanobacteria bacterium REEB65]|nr:SagB/ThcOx family dehydrogenase [Cyanobacteria bacterium REEB65]